VKVHCTLRVNLVIIIMVMAESKRTLCSLFATKKGNHHESLVGSSGDICITIGWTN